MEIGEGKQDGDLVALSLGGRIDPTSVAALDQRLQQAVNEGGKRLVLNLAGLEYISSAGLRVLLVTAKKLKQLGGKLVLCAVQRQVKEILDVSGFSSLFAITATTEEAIAAARR